MKAKNGKKAGGAVKKIKLDKKTMDKAKLVLAIALLGFIIFLLAYVIGFFGFAAETFALVEGVFLALITLYSLWKFDEIEKKLAVLAPSG